MSKEYNFKSTGKKYDDVIKERNYVNKINSEKLPFGIKTPLESGVLNNENLFKMHFSLEDQIEDNFKNLLLTRKGEKVGSNFGTNLRKVFYLKNKDEIQEIAMLEISNAVETYLPIINLIDSTISESNTGKNSGSIYDLTIQYRISGVDKTKKITVKIDTAG